MEREISEATSSRERIEAELVAVKNNLKISLTEIADLKVRLFGSLRMTRALGYHC